MGPHYDLQNFRNICGTTSRHGEIKITTTALKDAREHFGLKDKREVLQSIDSDLKSLQLDNSTTLKNGPGDVTIIVDSYLFKLDGKEGYLAFYFNSKLGNWLIKSFHDPRGGKIFGTTLASKLSELNERLINEKK